MNFFKKLFSDDKVKKEEIKTDEIELDLDQTKLFVLNKKVKPPRQALPAVLKVISGADRGLEVKLEDSQINIGRLPGSELLLKDTGVSRLHAFIVNENGQHILYDGKSMNGTYLNDQRVTKKQLNHGDSIKIASTIIIYELQ